MNKLDKLYLAALKAKVKIHKRIAIPGTGSALRNPVLRANIMEGARWEANYLLKKGRREARESKRISKGCSKEFFDSYLETALWSSTDESTPSGGEPLDKNYSVSDFTAASLKAAKKDCDSFCEYAREELSATGASDSRNGHDFWLTRNGHGAGFWDRGYDRKLGDELSKKAKSFGDAHIMVNRGRLHYQG